MRVTFQDAGYEMLDEAIREVNNKAFCSSTGKESAELVMCRLNPIDVNNLKWQRLHVITLAHTHAYSH